MRETISKKTRFEVFKRDGFRCAYCGSEPPSVVLEVDHIEPVSKGGENDIYNYITACFDCNRGKSNTALSSIPIKLNENLDILKEKEEQLIEYRKFITKITRRENKDINDISKIYSDHFKDYELSNHFKKTSLKKFLSSLPKHIIEESLNIAISKIPDDKDSAIKYFCGICWNKIKSNDPENLICKRWVELSKSYSMGSGYFRKHDLSLIRNIPIESLEIYMHETFSKRRSSYWSTFIEFLKGNDLI